MDPDVTGILIDQVLDFFPHARGRVNRTNIRAWVARLRQAKRIADRVGAWDYADRAWKRFRGASTPGPSEIYPNNVPMSGVVANRTLAPRRLDFSKFFFQPWQRTLMGDHRQRPPWVTARKLLQLKEYVYGDRDQTTEDSTASEKSPGGPKHLEAVLAAIDVAGPVFTAAGSTDVAATAATTNERRNGSRTQSNLS